MIEQLIKKAKDNWKVILSEEEAKNILSKQPYILTNYRIQYQIFGGIKNEETVYSDIK